jgi:hypothetical protein
MVELLQGDFAWLSLSPQRSSLDGSIQFFVFNPVDEQEAVDICNIELTVSAPAPPQDDQALLRSRSQPLHDAAAPRLMRAKSVQPSHAPFDEGLSWRTAVPVTLRRAAPFLWTGSLRLPAGRGDSWVLDYSPSNVSFAGCGTLTFCIHSATVTDGFAPVVETAVDTRAPHTRVVFAPPTFSYDNVSCAAFYRSFVAHLIVAPRANPTNIGVMYEAIWHHGLLLRWMQNHAGAAGWAFSSSAILQALVAVIEPCDALRVIAWALLGQVLLACSARALDAPTALWNFISPVQDTDIIQLLKNISEKSSDAHFAVGRDHLLRFARAGVQGLALRDCAATLCTYRFSRALPVLESLSCAPPGGLVHGLGAVREEASASLDRMATIARSLAGKFDKVTAVDMKVDLLQSLVGSDHRSGRESDVFSVLNASEVTTKVCLDASVALKAELVYFRNLAFSLSGAAQFDTDLGHERAVNLANRAEQLLGTFTVESGAVSAQRKHLADSLLHARCSDTLIALTRAFGQRLAVLSPHECTLTTVAGSGAAGLADGASLDAALKSPYAVAQLRDERVLILDRDSSSLRCIKLDGKVVTLIGKGGPGVGPASGFLCDARLSRPRGLCVLPSGEVVIVDSGNHCVRLLDASLSKFSTIAGSSEGFEDGSPAKFRFPCCAAAQNNDIVYISDQFNNSIRVLSRQANGTWVATKAAGPSGQKGHVDGKLQKSLLNEPTGLVCLPDGAVVFCDSGSHCIRSLGADGVVRTIAGVPGTAGFADGAWAAALFSAPSGIALDLEQNIVVADCGNNLIRMILGSGQVSTLAGKGTIFSILRKEGLVQSFWS